jgi:helicase MOV-10
VSLLNFHLASRCYNNLNRWSVTTTSKSSLFEISITRPLSVVMELKHSFIGRYEDRIEFVFEDSQLKQHFIISRTLRAIVGNAAEHEALAPKVPYTPRTRSTRKPIQKVVEGVKPPALNAIPYIGKLPRSVIPSHLASILSNPEGTAKIVSQIRMRFLPATLNSKSYGPYFKQLLWAEEYQAECVILRIKVFNAI